MSFGGRDMFLCFLSLTPSLPIVVVVVVHLPSRITGRSNPSLQPPKELRNLGDKRMTRWSWHVQRVGSQRVVTDGLQRAIVCFRKCSIPSRGGPCHLTALCRTPARRRHGHRWRAKQRRRWRWRKGFWTMVVLTRSTLLPRRIGYNGDGIDCC
ncbi:hypothetical protein LZ31DRAFT_149974 [Colletotrichum somersetense]|nr:hypothetical protein LZ31DRAFT_149974 [Colletotrichum somersetense]